MQLDKSLFANINGRSFFWSTVVRRANYRGKMADNNWLGLVLAVVGYVLWW